MRFILWIPSCFLTALGVLVWLNRRVGSASILDEIDTILTQATINATGEIPKDEKLSQLQHDLKCTFSAQNDTSCPPQNHSLQPYSSSLCSKLASKRIMFLGSSQTFTLHKHLLSYISQQTPKASPHTCLGPEFCTFHHICLNQTESLATSMHKTDRRIKPPSPRDLFFTNSSLMHYVQSSSLYPGLNAQDPRYNYPEIDPSTDVRMSDLYWLGPARRADIILLNRGPLPAPSWTYDGSYLGNWTFLASMPSHIETQKRRDYQILNAALHVTLTRFLPEVLNSLQMIRKATSTSTPIIWHGSRRQLSWRCTHAQANQQESINTTLPLNQDLAGVDPWSLYHDNQGTLFHPIPSYPYNQFA